jgi:hypothetical protein
MSSFLPSCKKELCLTSQNKLWTHKAYLTQFLINKPSLGTKNKLSPQICCRKLSRRLILNVVALRGEESRDIFRQGVLLCTWYRNNWPHNVPVMGHSRVHKDGVLNFVQQTLPALITGDNSKSTFAQLHIHGRVTPCDDSGAQPGL